MTMEKIAYRAKMQMIGAGVLGMAALIGAMVLSCNSETSGYALIWLAIGLVNVVIYALNLRIYRRETDT